MSSTTVTIGMPVFNGERHLAAAIEALLSQSHRDLKLVICDNASTDSTAAICERYSALDGRLAYHRNPSNLGAAGNFSRALSLADTDFFMWAAHDDLWHPDFVKHCLKALQDAPDAGFAFPVFALKSTRWHIHKRMPKGLFNGISSTDRKTRVLSFINTHSASHKCNLVYSLFRTELVKEAYRRHDISDDGLLATIIVGLGRGLIVDGPLFYKQYKNLWPRIKRGKRSASARPRTLSASVIAALPHWRPNFRNTKIRSMQSVHNIFPTNA